MRNQFVAALAALVVVGLYGPASASILIDNYSETTQFVSDPSVMGSSTTDEDALAAGEGQGQTRYVHVNLNPGSSGLISLAVNLNNTAADQASSVNANGDFLVGYDGTVDSSFTGAAGALNLDFSGLTALGIDAVSDLGSTLVFTLWNGANAFTSQLTIPGTSGLGSMASYVIPFASFTGSGSLDLSDITAIAIASPTSTGDAKDVAFTNFVATTPEPASLVLLMIGGTGLTGGAWRRRRKQRSAAA